MSKTNGNATGNSRYFILYRTYAKNKSVLSKRESFIKALLRSSQVILNATLLYILWNLMHILSSCSGSPLACWPTQRMLNNNITPPPPPLARNCWRSHHTIFPNRMSYTNASNQLQMYEASLNTSTLKNRARAFTFQSPFTKIRRRCENTEKMCARSGE